MRALGAYLNQQTINVDTAQLLAYGVEPLQTTQSGGAGEFSVEVPAGGQVLFFMQKVVAGNPAQSYFPSYNTVTTNVADIAGQYLYIAENPWVNEIATAHNVDLVTQFACHDPAGGGNLDPNDQCTYAIVVGRISDDGTAGNGEIRPVANVSAADFSITGGANNGAWYTRGPYFLDYTGTSSAAAQSSIVFNDNGNYRGGYYIFFAEIPATVGPPSIDLNISITYNDGRSESLLRTQLGPCVPPQRCDVAERVRDRAAAGRGSQQCRLRHADLSALPAGCERWFWLPAVPYQPKRRDAVGWHESVRRAGCGVCVAQSGELPAARQHR